MEFALLTPVLVFILVGLIEVGWALHSAASIRWALEQSARSLMIDPNLTSDQLRSSMVSQLSGLADSSNLNVTLTRNAGAKTIVVQSTYSVPLSIPFVASNGWSFTNQVTVPNLG